MTSPVRSLALVGLGLAACFVDNGPPVRASDDSSTITATTGTATTTTTDATTDPITSTDGSTSAPPVPVCGDGELADGEQCDDGNLDSTDKCNVDCTFATCTDGHANQGESDVDCGGPCIGCGPCLQCVDADDCGPDLTCVTSRCTERHDVTIDWLVDCSEDSSKLSIVPTVHAGDWRITALAGGGRLSPVAETYGFRVDCVGFDLTTLTTELIYPSADDAFAALDPKSIVVPFAGGPTACGLVDAPCTDNDGTAMLLLELACE